MGDVFIALQFASNDANLILTQNQIKDIGCVTPILLETVHKREHNPTTSLFLVFY